MIEFHNSLHISTHHLHNNISRISFVDVSIVGYNSSKQIFHLKLFHVIHGRNLNFAMQSLCDFYRGRKWWKMHKHMHKNIY